MISRKKLIFFSAIFIFALVTGSSVSPQQAEQLLYAFESLWPAEGQIRETGEWHMVSRVVDGDTIEIDTGERVRYIGINAPESVKPNSSVECFGFESGVYNKQLVEGKRVRLEKDVSERDKYGRLLRFVYLEDGTLVNGKLVHGGYAYADTFPPDIAKADELKQAQREARASGRGLWAESTCKGKK